MKIVYAVQYYPPHTGGLEKVAQKLALSAATQGHEVHVVTFALPGTQPGTAKEDGVMVHRVRGWHFFDRVFGIPFCLGGFGLWRTMCQLVRAADVVHLHDVFYLTSLTAFLAARRYHKPILLTQHVAMVAHGSLVMLIEKLVYSVWGTRIFHAAERIVTYQRVVADFVRAQGVPSERVVAMHNGIETDRFAPVSGEERRARREKFGVPREKPLVLFVGRFVPKKGYRALFEARSDAYDLVFVGSGTVPEAWRTTPGVHVLGERSQEEVALLMPVVDVFAAPSQGEMWTLSMQEALACGLPLVAGDAPEYAGYDLDRSRIVLCEPTPESLKAELTRVCGDEALRERMGAYSRELAERYFDWEKNVHEVLALYDAPVLNPAPRSPLPVVVTSWDDGHVLDMKLAALLERYGVRGTFYVAPEDHELKAEERLSPEQIRALGEVHEIGAHTVHHEHLTTLDDAEAGYEIAESKRVLEDVLQKPVTSFCYPAGKYTARHVEMVREAGFTNARTVRRFVTAQDTHVYELGTSIHTYDHWLDVWGVLQLARWNPLRVVYLYRHWDRQAKALFDRALQTGGVFHLWGHSEEVDRHNDWERLEGVLQYISGREGVRYETVSGSTSS